MAAYPLKQAQENIVLNTHIKFKGDIYEKVF